MAGGAGHVRGVVNAVQVHTATTGLDTAYEQLLRVLQTACAVKTQKAGAQRWSSISIVFWVHTIPYQPHVAVVRNL